MIIARFQQRQNGTLYKKGDKMEGFSDKRKAQLVASGHADWVAETPDEMPDNSWTVSDIKDFMDEWSILYTSDMLKQDLLDKIEETF